MQGGTADKKYSSLTEKSFSVRDFFIPLKGFLSKQSLTEDTKSFYSRRYGYVIDKTMA